MANLPFPWRAEDLPSDSFWFRSGKDGWDFHAQRKTQSSWTTKKANPKSPEENEDRVCYGVPVYAIAEGEVISAWRNAPENIRPGEPHPGRLSTPKTIPRSGNFIVVLGDDGSVILYAHMTPGSVPKELCPFTDEFVKDADDKVTPTGAPNAKVPRETMLPAGNRPRVRSGQFIGRVGNSGASSGPHLHIHRKDADGNKQRFSQDRAWMNDKSNLSKWQPFNGQVVGAEDKQIVILASPVLRRGDIGAGGFSELAQHFVRSRRLITALQDENNNLKLITWDLTADGQFIRRGDTTAGRASKIAIAEPQSDIIVTALRDGDGNLLLISWRVETNGNFTRCDTASAGPVNRVDLITQKEGIVVTAVRTASGDLKLIAWSVASQDGAITRRGEANAGAISDLTMCSAPKIPGVVTAVRDSSDNLKLITWQVSNNGAIITRRADAEAGKIGSVKMINRGNEGRFLLTAVRDGEGKLRLISWSISSAGVIERLGTLLAGQASEIDLSGVSNPNMSAIIACRDNEGLLRLLTCELSNNGKTITRWGGALAGAASNINISGTRDANRNFFVTSCKDSAGKLKLINWEANL